MTVSMLCAPGGSTKWTIDARPPPSERRWSPHLLLLSLGLSVSVAYGALYYGFSVLITGDAAGRDFSTSVLSAAYGGAVLSGGIVALPVGRFADRHGVRGIVALGSVLGGLGLVAFGAAAQAWQVLAVWWLLLGPATAMTFYEPAYVAVGQWFAPDQRPTAIAELTLMAGCSGPVFLPTTSLLVEHLGWRLATLVLAVLLAATGLAAAGLVLRQPPHNRAAAAETGAAGRSGWQLGPHFVVFTVGALLAYGALEASIIHRVAWFEQRGFAVGLVTTWAGASGLLTLPGRFVLPALGARVPPTGLLAGVLLAMALATAFAVDGTASWELAGYFCLFGLVFGAALPLRAVVMSDWYAGPAYGAIMGLQALCIAAARAAGPLLVGLGRDASGTYMVPVLVLVLALAGSAVLVVASGLIAQRAAR